MRRILSVWLPSWATQRLRREGSLAPADATAPLATVESVRGVRRLAAIDPRAAEQGLRPEQALAEARAVCPALVVVDADPEAERAALERLAAWCERFTPLAAADGPDGLWLDVTGCAHLFGGEAALMQALVERLARGGLVCRAALAGTTGAAWALARAATAREAWTVLPEGGERDGLALLPVALLRLDRRVVGALRRVGLKTVGQLARMPRGELSARFGPLPVLRLDQAFGDADEVISWPHPPPPWQERLAFAEPIGTAEDLRRALEALAARLCARLDAERAGGVGFTATFLRVDDARPEIAVGTALPVRDPVYVAKLLAAKLDTLDPGFGVEAVVLAADDTAALAGTQAGFGDAGKPAETALAATIDQLTNRLGRGRVWRAVPRDSHIPERAVQKVAPLARPPTGAPSWEHDPTAERPVRLLRRPEPIEVTAPVPDDPPILFRWRGTLHRMRAATGPERIGPEWWRKREGGARTDRDRVRDYYRVEDTGGGRFWIFRAGLHGEADGPPRWYLHGMFG